MNKIKHKQVLVKLNNKSVVIYYSLGGQEMRFPTGIKIGGNKTNFDWVYWDAKNKRLRIPNPTNYTEEQIEQLQLKQKTIDDLVIRANGIINDYFSRNILITPDELKTLLSNQQDIKYNKANTPLLDYYETFRLHKEKHFNTRGASISIKDYNSVKWLLEDFQAYQETTFRVHVVDSLWLEELVQFCSIPHEEYYGEHKVSTDGVMKNSTILKRLDILGEFYNYLHKLKVVTLDVVDAIKDFKKTIKKEATNKETLTIEEIHALYQYNFTLLQHQMIRDIFVFLCLTGIRYQDLANFDRKFIRKQEEGFIYKRAASKTGIDYNIPLCEIVLEILEKYKYQLPKITDQYGNRIIKEALKLTKLFDDTTQVVDKKTKKHFKRHQVITLHKGRNSFITNLVDKVPLNELMKYTGHKKLSTLQGYIDKKRPIKMDYIKVFDMKKRIPKP